MHFHPLLHYHAFGARDAFMCIAICICILDVIHIDAFRCMRMCCILILHFNYMMNSCALPYVCILYVMHVSAFRCMQMRCILMHSYYDAFTCINSFSCPRRRNTARFGCATRARRDDSMYCTCFMIASCCVRMHRNTNYFQHRSA